MTQTRYLVGWTLCCGIALLASGCAQTRDRIASRLAPPPTTRPEPTGSATSNDGPSAASLQPERNSAIQLVAATVLVEPAAPDSLSDSKSDTAEPDKSAPAEPEEISSPPATETLRLDDVVNSVISSFPLLNAAMFGRNVARGNLLASNGEFDLKLKADTLNMPLGFYENYRQAIGAEQPLFGGGSAFGGYRLGTGNFPTYYGERETKLGGEFKVGMTIPLAQNRRIDDRRAALWRNRWEVQSVEPEIQTQLIEFIRSASIAYWNCVAAGQNVRIVEELLNNATERNDGLRTRVEEGDAPAIELTDNQRLIVSRRTKLIDARRKLQQATYKLSLFLRDESGAPRVVDEPHLPREFPQADDPSQRNLDADIQSAVMNRPEIRALAILREQLNVDLAAAYNSRLPQIDAVILGSQDVGPAADPKKDDKSPLELEAGLIASVPLQRRKARGKSMAVEGKLAQLQAKTQFTREKIVAEVQSASAALNAAYQQLQQAHEALDLARKMEAAERRKFDLGDSNLLLVNLREQGTADAAATEVEARLGFFDAQADYRAALANDVVP